MIDIVLVNWNSGDYLKTSIVSVCKKGNDKIINKVYLIDNNSADDSIDNLPESDKLAVIKSVKNEGFSKAANQGLRLCKSILCCF